MKFIFITVINIYKTIVSPVFVGFFGHGCRHYPTCSDYALRSIENFGVVKGGFLAVKRILKCHPFSKGGYDPVI